MGRGGPEGRLSGELRSTPFPCRDKRGAPWDSLTCQRPEEALTEPAQDSITDYCEVARVDNELLEEEGTPPRMPMDSTTMTTA